MSGSGWVVVVGGGGVPDILSVVRCAICITEYGKFDIAAVYDV
jgi:hypothetical protein